jgi:hypothetical protein
MTYNFGKLFTFKYIDADSSAVGEFIEFCDVTLIKDFGDISG